MMRATCAFVSAFALCTSLLVGPSAHGAPLNEVAQKQARQLTADGAIHFRLGRFREALDAYTKAYEVAQLPALLFNIGQCHKMLGNHARAVFFFEGFLRELPEAKSRQMVEALIAESKKEEAAKVAAEQAATQAEAARQAEREAQAAAERTHAHERELEQQRIVNEQVMAETMRRGDPDPAGSTMDSTALRRRSRAELIAGGTLLGLGAAGLAAGLGLGLGSHRIASDLEQRSQSGSAWDATAQLDYDRGDHYATGATAAYVVGGVLAATGVVLVIFGARDRARGHSHADMAGVLLFAKGTQP